MRCFQFVHDSVICHLFAVVRIRRWRVVVVVVILESVGLPEMSVQGNVTTVGYHLPRALQCLVFTRLRYS
ncbi:hypothetical protein HanPSC8_Chr04g0181901 [Helianthus annuus]|nr:hypothetical protein HanPSC8_Chr04g0181901 [Helianthus annuus]